MRFRLVSKYLIQLRPHGTASNMVFDQSRWQNANLFTAVLWESKAFSPAGLSTCPQPLPVENKMPVKCRKVLCLVSLSTTVPQGKPMQHLHRTFNAELENSAKPSQGRLMKTIKTWGIVGKQPKTSPSGAPILASRKLWRLQHILYDAA